MNYEEIIKKHRGLILSVVNGFCKYNNNSYSAKDLEQVAHLSLLNKLDKFDESRGKITTFIVTCIKHDLIKYINKHNTAHQKFPTDIPSSSGELNIYEYETNDPIYNEVLHRKVNGDTHSKIKEEMGLTPAKLQSILNKIKKNIMATI